MSCLCGLLAVACRSVFTVSPVAAKFGCLRSVNAARWPQLHFKRLLGGAPIAFHVTDLTVILDPVPHHFQTGLVLQERCGLPVTVKLRAGMRYKTFHGLPALKGGALHGCPGERPDPKSGATVGAPVAAQLPDMRAHRYARPQQQQKAALAGSTCSEQDISAYDKLGMTDASLLLRPLQLLEVCMINILS